MKRGAGRMEVAAGDVEGERKGGRGRRWGLVCIVILTTACCIWAPSWRLNGLQRRGTLIKAFHERLGSGCKGTCQPLISVRAAVQTASYTAPSPVLAHSGPNNLVSVRGKASHLIC